MRFARIDKPGDPRNLPIGCSRWDCGRPYLTWHRDLAAVAQMLIEDIDETLTDDKAPLRRRQLNLTAQAWQARRLSDLDTRAELGLLSPRYCEWIGTFQQLCLGGDEFARDVRSWYWDQDPNDAPIPDTLLDDFIETIQRYGET